ncbi:MAG TPA: GNAT family N-acyltransferase [Burkholderiaceae bacterium]|nr:GNAT family N-acyltransferase [Burkholderiaceae bacterium]
MIDLHAAIRPASAEAPDAVPRSRAALLKAPAAQSADAGLPIVRLAETQAELTAAQRLRFDVFASEYGARLATPVPGLDIDPYDGWCDHLIAIDPATQRVIGCYRMLPMPTAASVGACYMSEQFFVTRLARLAPQLVEFGRTCVHPDYRNTATLLALWSGLARYMKARNLRYAIGCASVSLADGGGNARATWAALGGQQFGSAGIDEMNEVFPITRFPVPLERSTAQTVPTNGIVPPLIAGYRKLGAQLIGMPAWDAEFNTADFPMLFDLKALPARYARHFGVA